MSSSSATAATSLEWSRCMMITMADVCTSFIRSEMPSRKMRTAVSRSASDSALSVECGSSTFTRSPRPPVIELKGRASLNPLSVFSNLPLAFWSARRVRGQRARY
ncbi:hypothetical protein D3C85_1141070 [compost metagenome]